MSSEHKRCGPGPGRAVLHVTELESRLTPATLVSPTTLTYQDLDGDTVTVRLTRLLLNAGNANSVFKFDAGSVNGDNSGKQQLQVLNLSVAPGGPSCGVSVRAARSPVNGGDGFVNVGAINAGGLDLSAVTIKGDLGSITAGDNITTTPAIGALTVQSLGRYGTSTGAPNLLSEFLGRVGTITVKSDVVGAAIHVFGAGAADDGNGRVGSLVIGGSLVGGAGGDSGSVSVTGDVTTLRVAGDVVGSSGAGSGTVFAGGKIGSLTLGGSLRGGSGAANDVLGNGSLLAEAGSIVSMFDVGHVHVGGNVQGDGGAGSAVIASARGKMVLEPGSPCCEIHGSLMGGAGDQSGRVFSAGAMTGMRIGGDVAGGDGAASGAIFTGGAMGSLTLGGSLRGGAGAASDVLGDGTLLAGAGSIVSMSDMVGVRVGGSIVGGVGAGSAVIASARGKMGLKPGGPCCEIAGSLTGGAGAQSGRIFSALAMTAMKIGGDVAGGDGAASGAILSGARIAALTVGGSLVAGAGPGSGSLRTGDDFGAITIRGSVLGNDLNRAVISARGKADVPAGATTDVALGRLTVNGRVEMADVLAGYNLAGGAVNADAQVRTVIVRGDWVGSDLVAGAVVGPDGQFGSGDDAKMAGPGVTDRAGIVARIGSVSVLGQAFGSMAGGDRYGIVAEQVGAVAVGGTAFQLSAGTGNDGSMSDPALAIGALDDFRVHEV